MFWNEMNFEKQKKPTKFLRAFRCFGSSGSLKTGIMSALQAAPPGGWSSPGAALAAVAADRLAVAVALLDDQADVGLHQLGDVHHLQTEGEPLSFAAGKKFDGPLRRETGGNQPFAFRRAALGPPRQSCRRWPAAPRTTGSARRGKPPAATARPACRRRRLPGSRPATARWGRRRPDTEAATRHSRGPIRTQESRLAGCPAKRSSTHSLESKLTFIYTIPPIVRHRVNIGKENSL